MFAALRFWWTCYSVSFPRCGKNRIQGSKRSWDELSWKSPIRERRRVQGWQNTNCSCVQRKTQWDQHHRHCNEDRQIASPTLPFLCCSYWAPNGRKRACAPRPPPPRRPRPTSGGPALRLLQTPSALEKKRLAGPSSSIWSRACSPTYKAYDIKTQIHKA